MSVANRNPSEPRSGSRPRQKTDPARSRSAESAAQAAEQALKKESDWGFSATYFVGGEIPSAERQGAGSHRLADPGANQVIEWLITQPRH